MLNRSLALTLIFSVLMFGSVEIQSAIVIQFMAFTFSGSPFGHFITRNSFAKLTSMFILLSPGLAFAQREKEKMALFGFITAITAAGLSTQERPGDH